MRMNNDHEHVHEHIKLNKPCVRDARYVRLILWTLRCGSEQLLSLFIMEKEKHVHKIKLYCKQIILRIMLGRMSSPENDTKKTRGSLTNGKIEGDPCRPILVFITFFWCFP